jgi:hypothetical protein
MQGMNIRAEQISSRIPTDKFNACKYNLWLCHLEELKNNVRKNEGMNLLDLCFTMKGNNGGRQKEFFGGKIFKGFNL